MWAALLRAAAGQPRNLRREGDMWGSVRSSQQASRRHVHAQSMMQQVPLTCETHLQKGPEAQLRRCAASRPAAPQRQPLRWRRPRSRATTLQSPAAAAAAAAVVVALLPLPQRLPSLQRPAAAGAAAHARRWADCRQQGASCLHQLALALAARCRWPAEAELGQLPPGAAAAAAAQAELGQLPTGARPAEAPAPAPAPQGRQWLHSQHAAR